MTKTMTDQLKYVIESQHGGTATFLQTVRMLATHNRASEWDGVVYIYDLEDHPKTKRAYAWSAPVNGSTKPRYFAVLHMGRVTGATEAVKAAAAAIRKQAAKLN